MREVVFEIKHDGNWLKLASMASTEPPGSLTSEEPDGRQVFLTGWLDGIPGLWRSQGGADWEVLMGLGRIVSSDGFDLVKDVSDGPAEFIIHNASVGIREFRLRLEEA